MRSEQSGEEGDDHPHRGDFDLLRGVAVLTCGAVAHPRFDPILCEFKALEDLN